MKLLISEKSRPFRFKVFVLFEKRLESSDFKSGYLKPEKHSIN